jgi:Peptidase family M28
MNFDPNTALQYAASIARPRRVGSGEDEVAAREIEDRLRSFDYRVEREPFTFSNLPNIILFLEILISLILIFSIFLIGARLKIIPAILTILLVFAASPINHLARSIALTNKFRFLKRYSTSNIVAALNDHADPSTPHLYLVAHYDSKSQRLSLVLRITLFSVALSSSLIFAAMTLLGFTSPITNLIGLMAILTGLPLLTLDVGNRSPGAIDNASGVGLVLHLAECLIGKDDPPDRLYNLTILIPSAEEFSLMGSAAYVQLHAEQLDREAGRTHVLNFDGIGVDGDLRWIGRGGELSDRIQQTCRDLNLKLGRFNMLGALYDHLPFADRGLDAVSLIAISPASRSIHTPKDSIDKLHVRGFDQAGRVALRVIERITTDDTDFTDK